MVDLTKSYIISHGFDESGRYVETTKIWFIAPSNVNRLHSQQWLWNMQLGWDLHPAITFKNDSEVKIVDHGCGNA
jgi:hypothetical protein